MKNKNFYNTKSSNIQIEYPFFIPVFRPDYNFKLFSNEFKEVGLKAVMVNAFLLYRDAKMKVQFENGLTLRDYLDGFNGVLCTDSGAFQQLGGKKVELDAVAIVKFQNLIKSDVAAPLDIITPPNTEFNETRNRMNISHYRIEEALRHSEYSDLAAIQQGGGFYSLRQQHIRLLAKHDFSYYGIGSMVPFFNKNHDLHFACSVISDARSVIGNDKAMHIYGAGDPLEIPFMFYAGANVFDSSSYAHYAKAGYYMTPFGAVQSALDCEKLGYECQCPICKKNRLINIFKTKNSEELLRQHNLFVIFEVINKLRSISTQNELDDYLKKVYNKHIQNTEIFQNSMLEESWNKHLSGSTEFNHILKADKSVQDGVKMETQETTLENELILNLAKECEIDYKMPLGQICSIVRAELFAVKNNSFRKKINELSSLREVIRLSLYKSFKKEIRAIVYSKLRRYKTSECDVNEILANFVATPSEQCDNILLDILNSHVSTKERLPFKNEFIKLFCKALKTGDSIIDVGCGLNPLIFKPEFFNSLDCYYAVDKDIQSIETIRMFAQKYDIGNLHAFVWDIADGVQKLIDITDNRIFDLSVILKVIPVVNRIDMHTNGKGMLETIANIRCHKMLITASGESMTKKRSIEKRERNTLNQFILDNEFNIDSEFVCGIEFGYYISRDKNNDN